MPIPETTLCPAGGGMGPVPPRRGGAAADGPHGALGGCRGGDTAAGAGLILGHNDVAELGEVPRTGCALKMPLLHRSARSPPCASFTGCSVVADCVQLLVVVRRLPAGSITRSYSMCGRGPPKRRCPQHRRPCTDRSASSMPRTAWRPPTSCSSSTQQQVSSTC